MCVCFSVMHIDSYVYTLTYIYTLCTFLHAYVRTYLRTSLYVKGFVMFTWVFYRLKFNFDVLLKANVSLWYVHCKKCLPDVKFRNALSFSLPASLLNLVLYRYSFISFFSLTSVFFSFFHPFCLSVFLFLSWSVDINSFIAQIYLYHAVRWTKRVLGALKRSLAYICI